jgi:hypothetical protein
MTDDTSDRRGWPGMRQAGAASMVGMALLAAACGGGSSASSAGMPSLSTITNQALAYAKCMRSRGIPNFPDPTVRDSATSKGVGFSMSGIDQNSPQFHSAAKTCQKQTGYGHITAAQVQAGMNAMLKYAECMRSHGITNFPNPFANSQQIGFNITGIDLKSSKVKAANKACQPLMPGGGP